MTKFAVFISVPYSDNIEENMNKTLEICSKIVDMGALPLCPNLWHYIDTKHKKDYKIWLNLSFDLLDRADCLFREPGISPGADAEVEKAIESGMPIFYSLNDLKKALEFGNL